MRRCNALADLDNRADLVLHFTKCKRFSWKFALGLDDQSLLLCRALSRSPASETHAGIPVAPTRSGRCPRRLEACVDRIETPPDVVIRRLPLYARSLRYLLDEDIRSVSSQELGERINVTAAQIRKDLSYFGEFGKQGIGYDVEKLLHQIERILGLNQEWP